MNQRYLMDTHAWLWANLQPEWLSSTVSDLITHLDNEVIFSVISAWEIGIKYRLGKLQLPLAPIEYIPSRLSLNQVSVLPVKLEHVLRVSQLPVHHNDPFDRLLIATAQIEGLTVITVDEQIKRYDVETVW
jgi:PIN domain nuclease of toxin-antitoxin system